MGFKKKENRRTNDMFTTGDSAKNEIVNIYKDRLIKRASKLKIVSVIFLILTIITGVLVVTSSVNFEPTTYSHQYSITVINRLNSLPIISVLVAVTVVTFLNSRSLVRRAKWSSINIK